MAKAKFVGPADDLSVLPAEIQKPAKQIDLILARLDDGPRKAVLAYLLTKHCGEFLAKHVELLMNPRPGPPADRKFKRGLLRVHDGAPRGQKERAGMAFWKASKGEVPTQDAYRAEIKRIRLTLRPKNRDK